MNARGRQVTFTPEQQVAIDKREGPLLLVAGAGSGKTTVLVERFVKMICEDGFSPAQLLAVTFTEKAAGELRERIRQRLNELGQHAAARELELAWMTTIHGLCARILRSDPLAAGLDPQFIVLDQRASHQLMTQTFAHVLKQRVLQTDLLDQFAAYGERRLAQTILETYEFLREQGVTNPTLVLAKRQGKQQDLSVLCEQLLLAARSMLQALMREPKQGVRVRDACEKAQRCVDLLSQQQQLTLTHIRQLTVKPGATAALKSDTVTSYCDALLRVQRECIDRLAYPAFAFHQLLLDDFSHLYAEKKRQLGAVDFVDLQLLVRDAFIADSGYRSFFTQRFERAMVDEFQDTNPLQIELLNLLICEHLFVVGDEFQSIYGFRHADVNLFRKQRESLLKQGRVASLAVNFRSEPQLLSALDGIFYKRFGENFLQPIPGRAENAHPTEPLVELMLVDSGTEWSTVGLEDFTVPHAAATKLDTQQIEAQLVSVKIAELCEEKALSPGDIAVLARTASALLPVAAALRARGIASALAGESLWENSHAQVLLAGLRALANPYQEPALLTFLTHYADGCLPIHVQELKQLAKRKSLALVDVLAEAEPRAENPCFSAYRSLQALRSALFSCSLAQRLERLAAAFGYDIFQAEVATLSALAEQFELTHGRDLQAFLDWCSEYEHSGELLSLPVKEHANAVSLLTMHAAKGLEFPVVVLLDLGRRARQDDRDLLVERSSQRVGLRVRTLAGEREHAFAYEELSDKQKAAVQAEEERILYVAATRAKQHLVFSGTVSFKRWPKASALAPVLAWLGSTIDPRLRDGEIAAGQWQVQLVDRVGHETPAAIHAYDAGEAMRALKAARSLSQGLQVSVPMETDVALSIVPAHQPVKESQAEVVKPVRFLTPTILAHGANPLATSSTQMFSLPSSSNRGMSAAQRGVLAHLLLEQVDFSKLQLQHDPLEVATALGVAVKPQVVKELTQSINHFLTTPLAKCLSSANLVYPEHPFSFFLSEEIILHGIVDVYAQAAAATIIVDYKTDHLPPSLSFSTLVDQRYNLQRSCYALAALATGAQQVEVHYVHLGKRACVSVEMAFEQKDRAYLQDQVHQHARTLQ